MGSGKYSNTLEELRDTRNFAKLATVYRYLAKYRDSIAAAAPKVPNGALDPTLKHLDETLSDYRDLATEITGFPVKDGDLRINLGDEFGAAGTPDTGQHASLGFDASQIDVVQGLVAAKPFSAKDLEPWDVNSIAVSSRLQTLYGHGQGGALRIVSRADMQTDEARFSWDAMDFDLASQPIVQEARGCVNRTILATAGVVGLLLVGLIGAWLAFSGGDDDDDDGALVRDTPVAERTQDVDNGGTSTLLDELSEASRADLAYLVPAFEGFTVEGSYVEEDAEDDAFTSFGDEVTFEDELTELVAGYGGRLSLSADIGAELTCGADTSTGMTVVCMDGASGALPEGDYVAFIGSVDKRLENWNLEVEYKYSAFVEDQGRALAFPDGDPRFPNNTLIRTNSFFSMSSIGGSEWALTGRWSEGQQFRAWNETPATDNTLSYVRGVVGGNTFMIVAPSELFSDELYFNVGTEAHPAGEEYTAENTTQDVVGINPQGMKPKLYNWLDLEPEDEEGEPIVDRLRLRVADYATWIRDGNGAELSSHLDRSATLRWGEETCNAYFSRVAPDPTFELEILDVREPATWDWSIYGIRVGTLFDAYEFDLNITQQGATTQTTAHYAWNEQESDIRIFSPCVTAEEAAAELAAAGGAPGAVPTQSEGQTPGPDAEAIRALLPGYEQARRDGADILFDYLHPVVIAFYGEAVCRDFYANQIGPDPSFAFGAEVSATGPVAYTYAPGGVTVGSAENVYSFVIDTTIGGQMQQFTWRFALIDGALKTFQRCER